MKALRAQEALAELLVWQALDTPHQKAYLALVVAVAGGDDTR